MIYTFYSYKGGVGRSMALANVAELLYQRGLNVLMIDFDLEAPGLERFFDIPQALNRPEGVLEKRGVVDMLVSYKELRSVSLLTRQANGDAAGESAETANGMPFSVEPLSKFIAPIYPENREGGVLNLLSAGRRSGEHLTHYAQRLRSFDWDDFYRNWDGELFFDWFRREVSTFADVVLIDSRTGISEISGVCAYQLADVVVMCVASNSQNLQGTEMLAQSLQDRKLIEVGRKGRELQLLFVPSRVEHGESMLLDQFATEFRNKLTRFMPSQLQFESGAFQDLKVPYIPYFAFIENVAVREPDRPSAGDLIGAFKRVTSAMVALASPSSQLYRKYIGGSMTREGDVNKEVPASEPIQDFTGREWLLQRIEKWLVAGKSQVFMLVGEPGSGKTAFVNWLLHRRYDESGGTELVSRGGATLVEAEFLKPLGEWDYDALHFVQALARQLADREPDVALAFAQSNDPAIRVEARQNISGSVSGRIVGLEIQHLEIGGISPIVAFDRLVRRALDQVSSRGLRRPIVIVVDGLDAASAAASGTDVGGTNLVSLLAHVVRSQPRLPRQVRFLLTTRADPRVLRLIEGERFDLVNDAASLVDDDIRAYARRRLHGLAWPAAQHDAVVEQVIASSAGNFLYARMLVDQILSGAATVPEAAEHEIAPDLWEHYRQSLKRLLSSNQWTALHRLLMGTLAVAHQPGLSRAQLAGIMGRSMSETANLIDVWGQFLEGPQPNGPFQLFHGSFREFLLRDDEFDIYPGEAHQAIAEYFLEEYGHQWISCEDEYALRWTPTHLVEASASSVSRRTRVQLLERLGLLLLDGSFVFRKQSRLGAAEVLHDLSAAIPTIREEGAGDPRLRGLLEPLEEQQRSMRQRSAYLYGYGYGYPGAAEGIGVGLL